LATKRRRRVATTTIAHTIEVQINYRPTSTRNICKWTIADHLPIIGNAAPVDYQKKEQQQRESDGMVMINFDVKPQQNLHDIKTAC